MLSNLYFMVKAVLGIMIFPSSLHSGTICRVRGLSSLLLHARLSLMSGNCEYYGSLLQLHLCGPGVVGRSNHWTRDKMGGPRKHNLTCCLRVFVGEVSRVHSGPGAHAR